MQSSNNSQSDIDNIIDFNSGVVYLIDFGDQYRNIQIYRGSGLINVPRYVKVCDGWLFHSLCQQSKYIIRGYLTMQNEWEWIKHPNKTGKVVEEDMSLVVWQLLSSIDWREIKA